MQSGLKNHGEDDQIVPVHDSAMEVGAAHQLAAAYLLQVGDSRCYLLRGGELTQITRDQTMAQELIDLGVLTRADASSSRLSHTLSSSIGGRQTAPVVTRIGLDWDTVVLLCSDGLSRHVPDERIRERLRSMTSARQVCEDLVQDALDAGGQDNIVIKICLARPPSSSRFLARQRHAPDDFIRARPGVSDRHSKGSATFDICVSKSRQNPAFSPANPSIG